MMNAKNLHTPDESGTNSRILRSKIQVSHLSSLSGPSVNCAAPRHYRVSRVLKLIPHVKFCVRPDRPSVHTSVWPRDRRTGVTLESPESSDSAKEKSDVIDLQVSYTTPRYANTGSFAKHTAVSQHRMRSHKDGHNEGMLSGNMAQRDLDTS